MAAPVSNHLVVGTVRDRLGNILVNATVTLTHATIKPILTIKTGSDGKYILNLGSLDTEWSVGQNITLFSSTQFKGRKSTKVTISSGTTQTVNLDMEETSDFVFDTLPQDRTHIFFALTSTYDGEKVTNVNPLPVNSSEIDLMFNPSTSWVITRSDLQPDSESVTLTNGEVHKRTFTYNSNDALISRSKWVKQ